MPRYAIALALSVLTICAVAGCATHGDDFSRTAVDLNIRAGQTMSIVGNDHIRGIANRSTGTVISQASDGQDVLLATDDGITLTLYAGQTADAADLIGRTFTVGPTN